MKKNPKIVNVRWHNWYRPYSEYPPEEAHNYEPSDDFSYRCDEGNEAHYSILEPQEVDEILLQIRAGAKLEMYRLNHFTDDDSDCLAEILERDALEYYDDDFLLIAACHLGFLNSPLIAELMIIYRLRKGDTVDEIVHDSPVGDHFYGDSELLEEEFLPFVIMCDRKRLNDKLDLELKRYGSVKRAVKI